MPIATPKHGLVPAEERSQHSGIEVGLPGQSDARLKIAAHEVEGIFSSGLADGRKTDRRIEDLSCQCGLPALFQIVLREHGVAGRGDRDHQLPVIFDGRDGRCPSQTVSQR